MTRRANDTAATTRRGPSRIRTADAIDGADRSATPGS
jgi:hypothetical protein